MCIVKYFRRKKELKLLLSYAHKLKNVSQYPGDYFTPECIARINTIHWLIAIYQQESKPELRAKVLLEKLINAPPYGYIRGKNGTGLEDIIKLNSMHAEIQFLYNWVYYKTITGF